MWVGAASVTCEGCTRVLGRTAHLDTLPGMADDALTSELEGRGIRRVKVGGVDVDGVLRGKYIHLPKLASAVARGFGFCDVIFGWDVGDTLYDNVALTGWTTGYPDALARVDPSTLRVLPSEPDTASFLVDFYLPNGKPHPACPRNLLKRVVARAEAAGYRPRFGVELEFWLFRETPESLADKHFRDLRPLSPGMFGYSWVRAGQAADLVHDVLDTMDALDVPIEGLHTETGPGVWEACIHYDDALAAADRAVIFKSVMKQLCHRHGVSVTFMAKWNAALPGASGHLHQSLWDSTGKTNLFAPSTADPDALLSPIGRAYLGGLVSLAPELSVFYAPFANSYKRYVPGVWAPMGATWGRDNRTCAVRVIGGGSRSAAERQATRFELRQGGADLNPYIAIAASLGAGLYGIERDVQPPPPSEGDATYADDEARALPLTLDAAIDRLRPSDAAREVLGEAFVDHFLRTREFEARAHRRAVSEWELSRYCEAV